MERAGECRWWQEAIEPLHGPILESTLSTAMTKRTLLANGVPAIFHTPHHARTHVALFREKRPRAHIWYTHTHTHIRCNILRIFTGGVVCREQRRAHTNPPLQLHHIANGHCATIVSWKRDTPGADIHKKPHVPDTHAAAAGLRFFHLTRTSPYGSHTTPTTGGTIHTHRLAFLFG